MLKLSFDKDVNWTTGLETGDTKPFWKCVRSQKQEHFGIKALRNSGSLYTDSSSKRESLNKQFKSEFTPPSIVETPKLPGQPFPPIKDLHITEHGVYKLIDGINTSKSSGPDGIPGKLFQSLANELVPVLRTPTALENGSSVMVLLVVLHTSNSGNILVCQKK